MGLLVILNTGDEILQYFRFPGMVSNSFVEINGQLYLIT